MNKHKLYQPLALTALIGCSVTFVADAQTGIYVETDLVVNKQVGAVPTLVDSNGVTHIAKFFDANLVNPWGIAESDASSFWISQRGDSIQHSGCDATPDCFHSESGESVGNAGGTPTGAVFNSVPATQGAFKVSGVNSAGNPVTATAIFLFRHLRTSDGRAIVIDRLWSVRFGDGGNGGSVNALYFTAEGRRFVRATVG